jgi:hypothetical protein
MIPQENGLKEVSFMDINPNPHFLVLLLFYINLIFAIECSQSQSLNSCKRVDVRSHIPELLGAWG